MTPPSPGPSPLEPLHVVLPLRTLAGGKARLGEALDAEERQELVLGMLLHTLDILESWPAASHVHVVSPDRGLARVLRSRAPNVDVLRQADEGLNGGVRLGAAAAAALGAASVLVLPGDLPDLDAAVLDELLMAADAGVAAAAGGALLAIVPSDGSGGTNALLLYPPGLIEPSFGSGSFEAHLRAAERAGVAVQVVSDPTLGFDLDTPDDLERLDADRLRSLMEAGRRALDRVGV
jgi:2-phospho-L-lactate guanylyltransferase